jgi:hypothetical protein
MLVFLYPENLLLPTLRPTDWQTQGFRTLIDSLPTGNVVTPDAACQAAREYSTYFEDICTLRLEASCQCRTRIRQSHTDPSNTESSDYRSLFYMFGLGGRTNKIYWSTYDLPGHRHTLWQTPNVDGVGIQGLDNVIEIVGATPYEVSAQKRFIFLFVKKVENSVEKLVFLTYDLENLRWSESITELDVPEKAPTFSVVLKQSYTIVQQPDSLKEPPHLAINVIGKGIYIRHLSPEGTGWDGTDFNMAVVTLNPNEVSSLYNMIAQDERNFYLFYESGANLMCVYLTVGDAGNFVRHATATFEFGGFFGAFLWPVTNDVYAYASLGFSPPSLSRIRFTGGSALDVSAVSASLNELGPYGNTNDGGHLVPTSGEAEDSTFQLFAYRREQFLSGVYHCVLVRLGTGDGIAETTTMHVTPVGISHFEIPSRLSAGELQNRRRMIEATFLGNALTYLLEAYYFIPVHLALQLQRSGEYEAALEWLRTVYDYTAPKGDERKIFYGLKTEESLPENYSGAESWLSDQLNPHAVAVSRGNTYTRFTLLSIIRCLLDYADSEFSQDTSESVARARTLYQTVLDLLNEEVLKQPIGSCEALTKAMDTTIGASISSPVLAARLKTRMRNISEPDRLRDTAARINDTLHGYSSAEQRFAEASRLIAQAEAASPHPVMQAAITGSQKVRGQLYRCVTRKRSIAEAVRAVGEAARADFTQAVAKITNLTTERLEGEITELPWLRVTSKSDVGEMKEAAAANLAMLQVHQRFQIGFVPSAASLWGCIPPNPVLASLRQQAEVNLKKLRSGRNIAGVKRELEPYSVPIVTTGALPATGAGRQLTLPSTVSIQPTLYRYSVLVDRAKQLTQTASQIEAEMLAALEKRDLEAYNLLQARQNLDLAKARVQLQALRLTQANDGVELANRQLQRAQSAVEKYKSMLDDKSDTAKAEQAALGYYAQQINLAPVLISAILSSGFDQNRSVFEATAGDIESLLKSKKGGVGQAEALANAQLGLLAAQASINAYAASIERTKEELQLQQVLAEGDVKIAEQQEQLAQDEQQVVEQESAIATTEAHNAQDTVAFLSNKFTNQDLYNWMSGVLEGVYGAVLRQATSMARLAQNQLAFERQEVPPAFIRADYWLPPSDTSSGGTNTAPDRKGLTGAERLLQDITQLDQYAFLTDRRKLQLVKTFSLTQLAPTEFQRFRETGVMTFNTPMELFDRDFPGHYLRLIKRVSTSVIALIPPNQGIRATLSSSGLSRVVVGDPVFQTIPIRRDPEFVALSSPLNATGVFELTPQSGTMLLPFENTGVDATWEFRMEKASNLFDYSTIADVLVTIEYTALSNLDYRQQVIQSLNPTLSADRPYSFRNQFPDQWYDLNNPEQSSTPMTVRFKTFPEDFPPNINDMRIQQVLLYFSRADGQTFEVPITSLRFMVQGGTGPVGGGATSIDGVISTRRGNAGSWTAMIGKAPFGDWELVLPQTDEMKDRFHHEDITDILFVITYSGHTPEWPS